MSAILLPNKFRQQPQYPSSVARNSLTRGLVKLFTPASGGATPIGGVTPIIGADGVGLRATSASSYYRASSTKIISNSPQWTVVAGFSTTQSSIPPGRPIYCERAASGNDILKLECLSNDTFALLTLRDDAGTLIQIKNEKAVNDGKFHIATAVRYSASDHRLFVDGLQTNSSSASLTTYSDASDSRIGADAADGVASFNDPIYFVALYNRALGQEEIAAIWDRRWNALFKAPVRRLWAASAGGTGYTLTADPFDLDVIGSNASLEYNRVLSADSASLSFDVADATLKRGYALTADPVSIDFSATDASLKYNRVLQADAATIQLTSADTSLEYNRALQADPAALSLIVSDATLTYTQPGNYVLTADPVTLGLTVSDASLKYDRKLAAEPTELAFNGADASLRYARAVIAEAAQIVFNVADATLSRTGGPEPITSIVERTATFQRSKSVTVRFN